MALCYNCGESGANYRRTTATSHSVNSWTSKKSYGSSSRTTYSKRSFCEDCAANIDRSGYMVSTFILSLIALGLSYYILSTL